MKGTGNEIHQHTHGIGKVNLISRKLIYFPFPTNLYISVGLLDPQSASLKSHRQFSTEQISFGVPLSTHLASDTHLQPEGVHRGHGDAVVTSLSLAHTDIYWSWATEPTNCKETDVLLHFVDNKLHWSPWDDFSLISTPQPTSACCGMAGCILVCFSCAGQHLPTACATSFSAQKSEKVLWEGIIVFLPFIFPESSLTLVTPSSTAV